MSKYRTVEIAGDVGCEYDLAYIIANGIPARCPQCKRTFEGRDAIHAPSLTNCHCFYCSAPLRPLQRSGPTSVEQVEQLRSRTEKQPLLELF